MGGGGGGGGYKERERERERERKGRERGKEGTKREGREDRTTLKTWKGEGGAHGH